MLHRPQERRRFGRVHLNPLLRGDLGGVTVLVKELSISGARLYESGLKFNGLAGDARDRLHDLVAEHVIRCINEQIANARGIPPLAAYSYQSGKGDLYRRCELIDGAWRRGEARNPEQPRDGFTVSADVDSYHVDLLCKTWELLDEEGRRLTQVLAQLSISKAEGIPTRRYLP